ncbi:C-Jun-amino-terminal kinase-interacting protein 1-like [Thunnus albacares]|uniref:C-Jun-amino-terminal kinase-interacting protein 1-like n=1 Tax=Thunnus maccoyii TaxID=8240 RepID=UPI001C4BC211|nr:C-Jun-amino-terminal kinase-interacting protein 1-like [Thunnus maccoyii]XP_042266505.1 C-Jun-amino-terminal kinase-interacting protein 1-like [Thunnus maccoyii]XP_044213519.1 C-Jun-amino-terminal kinase-interacting protein 1-like [Thunnus albacares]
MDKYRPKRPTTLALFPQLPQAGTQDSINNNSLGKKDSWKDSHSSSPHITGDLAPPDIQPKAEDKVRHGTRRPAPKPPTANGANSRANTQAAATTADTRARPRERQLSGATHTQSFSSSRSQRRGGGAGGGRGRGGGRGATAMRERSLGDIKGKDGVTAGKEDRRGGRLCEESKGKEKERPGHQRPREANVLKSRGADGRGKVGTKGDNRAGRFKLNNALSSQEVYLTAMVVPRTPVAPRNQDKKTQDQGQNHDRTQENPPVLSRSSSEGGSNRMSLSSDTEGPPPGPLHPSLSHRTNPIISEEEGEGTPTPSVNVQNGPTHCHEGNEKTEMDCTKSEVHPGGRKCDNNTEMDSTNSVTQGDPAAARTVPKSEASAGLNYDSVKYTLVVDEHAQLELVSLKDCLHSYNEHNDDSDAETVYQSANEEEDPEYEEERKRREETRKQDRRKEEEKRRKDEEEKKKRREEDVKQRREEEMKRRREVVARVYKQSKVTSTTTSEEEESNGGRAGAPRSRKFLNLFANDSSHYSATGAGSFGVFSCVLDGVERQQSHRAVYRFVPRHADELFLETDDPLLILNQSEDLWCQGYNMRTGATGIFPAFYAVRVDKDNNKVQRDGCMEQFMVRFLGSVQVPIHKGNDVLCAAMQKVAYNRRLAGQPPSACVLEVSVRGVKISVQDQCHSAHRGDQCFHFFQLKNISFCGCHPKHSKYFGFITKHPDQQRFACHVLVAETTLHPLAESVGRAFQQYYKEHIGYSCPTEDIFIE